MRFRELAEVYMSDPLSDFHKLRWVTKKAYTNYVRRLNNTFGDVLLKDINVRFIKEKHAIWASGGRIAMAHGLITAFRIVVGFGAGILEREDCQRIRGAMSAVKFKNAKPRDTFMTPEQILRFLDFALIEGEFAIALSQSGQWDWGFRQKDMIGEWVPLDADPRPSNIIVKGMKWVGGIVMDEINNDLVLTHETSKRGKILTFPIRSCPLVMDMWRYAPKSGPLIVDPETGLPFRVWNYGRRWRNVATKAGIPRNVWNMDSRAGRITDLLANGVPLEDARKFAGHSQSSTTSRYSRGTMEAIARTLDAVREPVLEQKAA